jgi:signal transduction histidine kinase
MSSTSHELSSAVVGIAQLTAVAEALPVAVAVLRRGDGIILYANTRFGAVLGVDDVVGRALDEVVAEPGTHASLVAAAANAADHAVELCAQRADRTPAQLIVSASPLTYSDEPDALLAAFHVVSPHGEQETLALLAELPEKNPGPVCRLARDGTILMANAASRRFFRESDPRGRSWIDLCPGMSPERWGEVLASETPLPYEAERDGVCILFTHVHSEARDVVFTYGADITARRQSERLLAEVARFPEMNPGPVLRMNTGAEVLLANAAARGVFGEELVGRNWRQLCPGIDEAAWRRVLEASGPVQLEARIGDRDYVFAHRHDPHTQLVFVFGADVTPQKQAEHALRQTEKMAILGTLAAGVAHELNNPAAATRRAAEQLRDAFTRLEDAHTRLATTALTERQRDLLQTVAQQAKEHAGRPSDLGPLERSDLEAEVEDWLDSYDVAESWDLAPALVAQGLGPGTLAPLAEAFEGERLSVALAWAANAFRVYGLSYEIGQGSARTSEIVGALKSYSYLGQAPIKAVDLHQGLNDTLVILRNKLKLGIEVRRDYGVDLPLVPAYGSELNQVWTNLIDNAADAMGGKGTITIGTRREGRWAVVEVVDDGPGIPAEIQSKIFEPFFTTKAPGKGTGLGLSTSYSIITDKHKGAISVESRPGFTRFTVRLPLDPPSPSPPSGDNSERT